VSPELHFKEIGKDTNAHAGREIRLLRKRNIRAT